MGHKVHSDIEDKHVGRLIRKVDEVAGNGLGGLVIEGIAVVLFNHGTLYIDSQDLLFSQYQPRY